MLKISFDFEWYFRDKNSNGTPTSNCNSGIFATFTFVLCGLLPQMLHSPTRHTIHFCYSTKAICMCVSVTGICCYSKRMIVVRVVVSCGAPFTQTHGRRFIVLNSHNNSTIAMRGRGTFTSRQTKNVNFWKLNEAQGKGTEDVSLSRCLCNTPIECRVLLAVYFLPYTNCDFTHWTRRNNKLTFARKIADKLFADSVLFRLDSGIVGPLDNVTLGSLHIQYPTFARSCHQSCCVRFSGSNNVTEKLFSNSLLSSTSIRFPLEMEFVCWASTAIENSVANVKCN